MLALRRCIPPLRRIDKSVPPAVGYGRLMWWAQPPWAQPATTVAAAAASACSRTTWMMRQVGFEWRGLMSIGFVTSDGFAIANAECPRRIIGLCEERQKRKSALRPQAQLRWMSWKPRIDFRDCQSLGEMSQLAYDHLETLSSGDISAFWTEVPKLLQRRNYKHRAENPNVAIQLEAILVHTLEKIETYGCRYLAQTALGIAKIVKRVEGGGRRNTKSSPNQILRDIFIGNMSQNKQFIFAELAAASMHIRGEFEPRLLSNFIYAFGLAECTVKFEDGRNFFDELALMAIPITKDFSSQGLSNMLWAYGNVSTSNPQLFQKVADWVISHDNLEAFKPQELSNIVWAYATLDTSHPKLFEKVADHITIDNLEAFKPQNLSNIVWAYATLDSSHPKLFKKVADWVISLDNLEAFKPQALSNIVWAYATADESHPKLFNKVADHIIALGNLGNFKPQVYSNIMWAYATVKVSNPKLFQKLANAARERHHELNSQCIANLLWACAANGQTDQHLFRALVPPVQSLLGNCNNQGLANIAWAYAVANVTAPAVFDASFTKACIVKENELSLEDLRQLHQWNLWQEESQSDIRLPPSLEGKCHDAFLSRVPTPSRLQDDVISELRAIGLQPEEEVLTERGYRLDAIVEVDGNKVAIEVDGPFHFLGRLPTGSTILKHRQIAQLERIPLVPVPYWEWDELGKDRGKKQNYLRSLLGMR